MEGSIDGACGTHGGGNETHTGFGLENLKEKDHLEDLRVHRAQYLNDLQEIYQNSVDWIYPAQNRGKWRALVRNLINLWFL